jgi:predicted DNA-binding transcriptional regulator YafY
MKNVLRRAMFDSETFVVEMVYSDSKGNRTRRIVSPIRFVGKDRFLGLCLCREEPRQFYLSRCEEIRLIPAAEVIMPMPMETVEPLTTAVPLETAVPLPSVSNRQSDVAVACLV